MCSALIQSVEYADALRHYGTRLSWKSGQLLLHRRIAGVPLTLASRIPTVDADWMAALPRGPVILNPERPTHDLAEMGAVPIMTPATYAHFDLTADAATRRQRLHQKWRNRLRQAEQSRLKVIETALPPDPSHWLFQTDGRQQKRRGYRNWPARLTCAFAALHPAQTHLFSIENAGQPIAAMLFLRHGSSATYHIGVTTDEGRDADAHRLILWHACQTFADRGVDGIDLGFIDTDSTPGLARFKLGIGASARQLGGTWLWWPPLARLTRHSHRPGRIPQDGQGPRFSVNRSSPS